MTNVVTETVGSVVSTSWQCDGCGEIARAQDAAWVERLASRHRCFPIPCPDCGGTQPCDRMLRLAMAGCFDG